MNPKSIYNMIVGQPAPGRSYGPVCPDGHPSGWGRPSCSRRVFFTRRSFPVGEEHQREARLSIHGESVPFRPEPSGRRQDESEGLPDTHNCWADYASPTYFFPAQGGCSSPAVHFPLVKPASLGTPTGSKVVHSR